MGNPALPSLLQEGIFVPDISWSNPQCGASGDYLIQKRLRPCQQSDSLGLHHASLWGQSEMAIATWSIRERFNLQIELGSGQFFWQWQQGAQNLSGQSTGGLIGNADAKLVIFDVRDTMLAVDAHAGGWMGMGGSASINGTAVAHRTRAALRYWQLGVAMTQKISIFSPYLGVAVNRTHFQVSSLFPALGAFHARHIVGPFGGCSICAGSRFLINLEWRGWFEEGIALSAQLRL